jgi:hypothetical protein
MSFRVTPLIMLESNIFSQAQANHRVLSNVVRASSYLRLLEA